eukprot:5772771-Amphidinium_carterae.1
MHMARLTSVRVHSSSMKVLEEQEASMREAEVLTARERDGYFEQLMAAAPQIPTATSVPSAPTQETQPLPVAGP